jgi:glycosyltransferase involved in cell wall biosynthesis
LAREVFSGTSSECDEISGLPFCVRGVVMGGNATGLVYVVTDQVMIGRLLNRQLVWFADRNWKVTLICGGDNPHPAAVGAVQARIVRMKREISTVSDAAAFLRLMRILRKLRPAIVNAGTPKAGLLGMVASWVVGVPVRVYCLRGLRLETTESVKRLVLTLAEKLACFFAHKVICVSDSLRRKALELGLSDAEKLVVIGSGSSAGVDVSHFEWTQERGNKAAELRRCLRLPVIAPVIGFIGRLTRDKGIVELVEAFEIVSHRLPDARLLLVGSYEEADPVPANTRQKIASNPRIHRVEFVDNTSDYFHVIDVLALPTHREGFPNVVLEAAAAGKPVAATRATGVIDAVVDGVTGLLSPVGEPGPIASNLLKLLTDKELIERMGQAARRRAEDEFSIGRVSTELERFYLRLCREHGVAVAGSGHTQYIEGQRSSPFRERA